MPQPGDDRPLLPPPPPAEHAGSNASWAAWIWGTVVVAFLILQLVIGGFAYRLASHDPSVAVMPDYHHRALHWDDEMARRQRSEALDWTATLRWGEPIEDGQKRELFVSVVDRTGDAVTGGTASLLFFHHTRAADVATVPLEERSDGQYVASLPIIKLGLWDLEFSLQRGADEAFWDQRTIDVTAEEINLNDHPASSAE